MPKFQAIHMYAGDVEFAEILSNRFPGIVAESPRRLAPLIPIRYEKYDLTDKEIFEMLLEIKSPLRTAFDNINSLNDDQKATIVSLWLREHPITSYELVRVSKCS